MIEIPFLSRSTEKWQFHWMGLFNLFIRFYFFRSVFGIFLYLLIETTLLSSTSKCCHAMRSFHNTRNWNMRTNFGSMESVKLHHEVDACQFFFSKFSLIRGIKFWNCLCWLHVCFHDAITCNNSMWLILNEKAFFCSFRFFIRIFRRWFSLNRNYYLSFRWILYFDDYVDCFYRMIVLENDYVDSTVSFEWLY